MALPVFLGLKAATWAKLALTAASASYSYYANKKMLQDRKRRVTADDRPSATTTRGAYLPVLIGRRRLAPVIAWLEGRSVSRSGRVRESAGHLICVGPASTLHQILENGKVVFSQTITSESPSGSSFQTTNGRIFTIHWGDENPIDTDVPSEIGSLFPKVCYIKWENTLLQGTLWPDFTYDIEVQPLSNDDGVIETILGKSLVAGEFSDIGDALNGLPGINYVETEGDRVDDFSGGKNALIRFEEVPPLFDEPGWQLIPDASAIIYTQELYTTTSGKDLVVNNLRSGSPGYAQFDISNFPGEGKTIQASLIVQAHDTHATEIRLRTDSGIKASLSNMGKIGEVESVTGDINYTKYEVPASDTPPGTWKGYDIIFTVEDNIDEEEQWSVEIVIDKPGGFPPLPLRTIRVYDLVVQSGVEYDIRRVTLLDGTTLELVEKDMSLWTNTDYIYGALDYIDNVDPSYQTPPAEATDLEQNYVRAFQPPGREVYSEDSRAVYPNESGLVQVESFIRIIDGDLRVSANAGAGEFWYANITVNSGLWNYTTDSAATEVTLEVTSDSEWYKVTVKHTVQASESANFGNPFFIRYALISSNDPSEAWIQNIAYSSSTEESFRTRIELNEEIVNILTPFTGEVAPSEPGVIGGANPAGAIHQLLFSDYPYGAGLNKDDYDMTSLAALSNLLSSDSESLFMSILIDDGKELESILANILQDAGVMMYWDIYTGKYKFEAIREVFDQDKVILTKLKRRPEITVRHDNYVSNQFVFSFSDVSRKYKETTLIYDNDGEISPDYGQTKRSSQVRIPTAISYEVAVVIAERRSQEEMGKPSTVSVKVLRDLPVSPGQVITTPYTNQDLRVLSVVDDGEDNQVTLECTSEFYGLPTADNVVPPGGGEGGTGDPADPDEAFRIFELPRPLSSNQNKLYTPRIRANSSIQGAKLFYSTNGSSYNEDITVSRPLAGGTLNESLGLNTFYLMPSGPVINLEGPDVLEILDLIGSETDFRAGRQVVLIGDEIFFCESVTVLSATQIRLGRLIRARYGSQKASHNIGEDVYIWQNDDIIEAGLIPSPGQSLYLKTQPFTSTESTDLDDVTPDNRMILGDGTRPMRPYAINTPEGSRTWVAGDDIEISWRYRNGNVDGAGSILAGQASINADPEGTFTLLVYDSAGVTLKRTETGLTSPMYTYTNANLVSDFAGEPTGVLIKVINIASTGLTSDVAEQQIEKV